MSRKNKVIWSEGLFLKPTHFQQHDRYVEGFVEKRCRLLSTFSWGFDELNIDADLLNQGKLSIKSARGVLPDGTPFNIPEDDESPPPLEFPEGSVDQEIFLSLPISSKGLEVDDGQSEIGLQRYKSRAIDVSDVTSTEPTTTTLHVGGLRFTLMLADDKRTEYSCLGVAHVTENTKDKQIKLEKYFIPPTLNCQNSPRIRDFFVELNGLLKHRGKALAARVSVSGTGGAAEIADFLMLQVVNRYIPLVSHLASLPGLHPELAFQHLLALMGELATFVEPRTPIAIEPYRHAGLAQSYEPVMNQIREALSMVLETRATLIELKDPRYGIYRGVVADPNLFESAKFVVAVKAQMPVEELRKVFPNQVKVTSVEHIRDLVMSGLPGIPMQSLPVAPREIPFHAGFVYFELERNAPGWEKLKGSSGFAIHVGGQFSGLELEFWAIQR